MGSLASISCARGLNLAGRHDLSSNHHYVHVRPRRVPPQRTLFYIPPLIRSEEGARGCCFGQKVRQELGINRVWFLRRESTASRPPWTRTRLARTNELDAAMDAYMCHVLGRHSRAGRVGRPPLDPILEEHVRPNQPSPSRSTHSHSGLLERS